MSELMQEDALQIFKESGALLSGHFVLTSGKHSPTYFEKFHVLRHPRHVETLCRALAEKVGETKPDVVLGPTTLGVLLAYEVAKHLEIPAAYGEKNVETGTRFLRRPEHIEAGARVLVVDDVLTTGGSVRECIELVERQGATLCGVGVLLDRSGGKTVFPAPLFSLVSLDVTAYEPDAVPPWLAAVPLTRPGSTGKK